MIRLSVVIPTFNEQSRILTTLERVAEHLGRQTYSSEILVVDDGSTDSTPQIVQTWISGGRGRHFARLIEGSPNRGKGHAVREGILAAQGELRLMCDADLSTPIEEIDRFWSLLASYDVLIGSRAVAGSRVELHQPFYRESLGKLFNRVIRPLTGLPFRDTQCGFKLFRAGAACASFEPLVTHRFAFDVEILLRAMRLGFSVAEVPVVWRNSPDTRVRAAVDGPQMLLDAIRIRRIVRSRS